MDMYTGRTQRLCFRANHSNSMHIHMVKGIRVKCWKFVSMKLVLYLSNNFETLHCVNKNMSDEKKTADLSTLIFMNQITKYNHQSSMYGAVSILTRKVSVIT